MSSRHSHIDLSPEGLAPYRETWRQRWADDERRRLERRARAWQVAADCAAMLCSEFGATRVAAYGSLARGTFRLHSDIDLAAWGISAADYFDAVARLIDVGEDFEVNLALYERCREPMQSAITGDAVDLP